MHRSSREECRRSHRIVILRPLGYLCAFVIATGLELTALRVLRSILEDCMIEIAEVLLGVVVLIVFFLDWD